MIKIFALNASPEIKHRIATLLAVMQDAAGDLEQAVHRGGQVHREGESFAGTSPLMTTDGQRIG